MYEPPTLAEVGEFSELTLGTVGLISDDGALRDN
ncbi:MAG: lasso RiPP family leader peptide-containing protein [Pseudonocardia sp.]